jgi:hypothetical protein
MLAQQTALVSDQMPRDLVAAVNTPLMTVTAGGKAEYSDRCQIKRERFVDYSIAGNFGEHSIWRKALYSYY